MNDQKSGIYSIVNMVNGNTYIGSSANISVRLARHLSSLRSRNHDNSHLQNAWDRYGEGAFVFRVILYCDKDSLISSEQDAIDTFIARHGRSALYNIDLVAGSRIGHTASQETRDKMSANNARPFLGHKHSDEDRARMSRLARQRCSTPEGRAIISMAFKGRNHSQETREKLRISSTKFHPGDMKTCSCCRETLPRTDEFFPKAGVKKTGYQSLRGICKSCHAQKEKFKRGLNKIESGKLPLPEAT